MLYEVKSRIIVAMNIVPANESDHNYFLPMVMQGIYNCGKDRIQLIIADRGFLNGAHLWTIKHKLEIDLIPAKSDMINREDAIGLYKKYKDKPLAEWAYGKGKCQGYRVDGLLSYLDYDPKGVEGKSCSSYSLLQICADRTQHEGFNSGHGCPDGGAYARMPVHHHLRWNKPNMFSLSAAKSDASDCLAVTA